jgi:SET domain-containing protein
MKKQLFQNKLLVKRSPLHGYGVFAQKKINKGELIEECYIIISRKGGDLVLEDFYFDVGGKYGVFTGFGSIYNHSEDPNADYLISVSNKLARIKAMRDIRKGEEIFVSYGDDWFKSRDMLSKSPKITKKKPATRVKKKKKSHKKKR